ncbi:MAG: kynureninase [Bacteroidales bacterium]|nr:kynureninase [Bacteroidales bacterium]
MNHLFSTDKDFAVKMDQNDPLAAFRDHFYIPARTLYMDGNSLGLLSKEAEYSIKRLLNEWRDLGIKGWLKGKQPWFYFAEKMGEMASGLVGAHPEELIMTGATTINIHSLVSTFYWPEGKRTRILADSLNFPTDIYALKGQIRMKNMDPSEELILVDSADGYTLNEDDIVAKMTEEVAVTLLPSVLYRSGQLLDMEYLTREAHKRGIIIGFDCSHSAGVVPHRLSEWGVDFAVFCSYKYLNGGPGSSAFLYLNRRHFDKQPVLTGWFGNKKETQFDMSLDFDHAPNAGGWQISSPGILGSSPVEGSLQLINEAGIEAIRSKSMTLTDYLVYLLEEQLSGKPYSFKVVSPAEASRRSGHIAITREKDAFKINEALKSKGVVPDFRPPALIRIAPSPLYNTYQEVWQVAQYLKEIIDDREFEKFSDERDAVS